MSVEAKARDGKIFVGRGVAEGARLFREWFSGLTELARRGETAAYCFVGGNLIEIMRTFDIPVTFPEINALQTAFRHVAEGYLEQAEDYGYSPDICGYVKIGVGIELRKGEHPMGLIPKPKLAVLNNCCNTFIKWGEIWERTYDCPVISLDYPLTRASGEVPTPGTDRFNYEKDYLKGQIQEVIEVCEKIAGRKFDIDKFRQILKWSNDVNRDWARCMQLNRNPLAVFNALTDGTVYLGVRNAMLGTEAAALYYRDLREELEYRTTHGIGALGKGPDGMVPMKQTFRLALVGTPCFPIYNAFNEMFAKWGGIFVYSSYLDFASPGAVSGYQYDLDARDPLDAYAAGQLITHCASTDGMFHQSDNLKGLAPKAGFDGVVFHPIKSCRTVSTGLADMRRIVSEDLNLPTLFIESDVVDSRVVAEAPMRNRVDAFFEGLISRRQQKHAAMALADKGSSP